jgi:3-oxoacyl-[acyl-carrier-protein] synthase-3
MTKTSATRVVITGTGSYLPERVLTNADLEKKVDTSDEWIVTRTGIRERHIAGDQEATSDMAAVAALRAMEAAAVRADEIDLILVATVTPDSFFPNTACLVQQKIGAKRAFCFDLSAACSGFLYGIETARCMIESGGAKTVLLIGAEKLSAVTDWTDRATCVLFGDGAGAVVLRAGDSGGILGSVMGSDGALAELLKIPAGGSRIPASAESVAQRQHCIRMVGNEVFKHAVRCMCDAGQEVVRKCGFTMDDVKWIIPHQANMRIIQAIASRVTNGLDRFCVNLDRVGNLSAASIPVALDEAVRDGRVARGDRVLFVAFGGGFTWGASLVEW